MKINYIFFSNFLFGFCLLLLSCNSAKYKTDASTDLGKFKYVYIETGSNTPADKEKKTINILSGLFANKGFQVLSKDEFKIISRDQSAASLITIVEFYYEIRSHRVDNKPKYNYSVPVISINMFDMSQKEIYSAKSSFSGIGPEDEVIKSGILDAFKGIDEKITQSRKDIKSNP